MEETRINALAEFLKVVPESLRIRARDLQSDAEIADKGERISLRLQDFDGEVREPRIDFDPANNTIVNAFCDCRKAKKGNICEHICALAQRLVDQHYSGSGLKQSLDFLDKFLNAPSYQNAPFRLSVELSEHSDLLEPNVLFHKFIKEGTFGVGRKFTANDSYKFTNGDPSDQNLLDYIRNFRQIIFYSNYGPDQRYTWGFWLSLLGHPRVTFEEQPLRVEMSRVTLDLLTEDEGYRLHVSHGDLNVSGLKYFEVDGGLLAFSREEGRLLVCQIDHFRRDIVLEVARYRPMMNRKELLSSLPRLEGLQRFFDLSLPSDLEGIIQQPDPVLILLLDLDAGKGFTLSPRLSYPGSKARVVPGSPGQYLGTESDVVIERNPDAEMQVYQDFLNFFPYEEQPDRHYDIHVPGLERALVLLDWLKMQKDLNLEWLRHEPKIHQISQVQGLRAHVNSKAWLKLHLMADNKTFTIPHFPEEDLFLTGSDYVSVGEGEWLQIDQRLRQQLNRIKMAVTQEKKAMKLKKAALAMLAEMENVNWEGDPNWLEKIDEWRGKGADKYNPSTELDADLRKYQIEGYRWLRRMSELGVGACLADDMGLGKTVQALAVVLDRQRKGPVLVVAPASVCYNWREEVERFAPSIKAALYSEGRRNKNLSRLKSGDIVVISYALVLKDIEKLKEVHWGTLILDEAQFIKNALSQTAIAVSKLDRDWTLALTGTPLENHLGELWSIFRMLNPELLGGWEQFRKNYVSPIEKDQDQSRMEALRNLIRPFILRRTKQNVLDDLPERSDIMLKVVLGDAQRARYEAERNRILSQLDESDDGIRFKLLAGITRLRQLACHPTLCEPRYKGESAKLGAFSELIEELVSEKHRVLVFSQFTSFLNLIALELNRIRVSHVLMTGDTPVKHRQAIIKRFQSGEVPVFLVSLRAGGTGLNLTSANYVIHMDPWWNPSVEEQATDRAHRLGQTEAVTVYRLVAANTIEETILDIHERKRDLVESLLDGKDKAGKLSIDDLISLIRDNR